MRLCPNCNREYKTGESVCPVCNAKIVETNEKGTARAISTLRLPKIPKKVILSVCALLLSVALIASGIGVLFYFMNNTPALLYLKNGDLYCNCENGRRKKLKEDIFKDMSEEEKDSFFERLVKDENRQILIYPASTVYKITETENLKSEPALRGDEEKVPYLTLKVLNLKNGKEYDIADEVTSFVYSSFGGVVIYEKSKDLYSYDVKEAKSTLLIENVRYYSLSESGEYMIYSDEDAKGTYWQRLGEETVFIEGISSFSKDLSTYAYIDGENKLYMYTPDKGLQHVADSVGMIYEVYEDGKIYYLTNESIPDYYKNIIIDDCPVITDDENVDIIRNLLESDFKDANALTLCYYNGEENVKLSDSIYFNHSGDVDWEFYYYDQFRESSDENPLLIANVLHSIDSLGEKIKLSEIITECEDFYLVAAYYNYLCSVLIPGDTWAEKIFIEDKAIDNPFSYIPQISFSNDGKTVYFLVGTVRYPTGYNKRINIHIADIKEKNIEPALYEKDVLTESISFLPDGTVTYFKEYMDYKRSGYLYRDRELLDKDAHIDSVAYSEELDALFWISGSDKEMTSGTLMMQKGGEILPTAYGIRDYRICCDGVYYIARSLSGEKYDLYFFNGEKTKRINTGVDSVIG